jgi:hypothetical protein
LEIVVLQQTNHLRNNNIMGWGVREGNLWLRRLLESYSPKPWGRLEGS